MKRVFILFFVLHVFVLTAICQTVAIKFERNSLRQGYAILRLENALKEKAYKLSASAATFQVNLSLQAQLGAESFSITKEKQVINIIGGDERGLIYGCLSLAEDIGNGISLNDCRTKNEKPFLLSGLSSMIFHGILIVIVMPWNYMIRPVVTPVTGKHFLI